MKHKTIKPIIFGISSTILSEEEAQLFKKNAVIGFILFSRNIESHAQVIELTNSLKNLYPGREVPIFIDQEGGRVARIKPPIASKLYPSGEYFASMYDIDPEQAKAELKDNYVELMSELKSLGIDSPCAPVCDIAYPETSDVIGDRSFGANADKVVGLCKSAIHGILEAGGMPFLKHIPGHGRATVDSHYELPIVDAPLEELEAKDFRVFQELSKEGAWGMTAHIIYSALDPDHTATTSPTVINYIRKNIGFTGTLVSDDLGMYALHGEIGKKIVVLERVIKLAESAKDWKTPYADELNTLLKINTDQVDKASIIDTCQAKLDELEPEFLESLRHVTKLSLEAGCNIVLHCSGDLEEMHTVCEAT